MHSKYLIWDIPELIEEFSTNIDFSAKNIVFIQFTDPFLQSHFEKLLEEAFEKNFPNREISRLPALYLSDKDIRQNFFQDLRGGGLFYREKTYFSSSTLIKLKGLLEELLDLESQEKYLPFTIFFFLPKERSFKLPKLNNKKGSSLFNIKELSVDCGPFWEKERIFTYWCKRLNVRPREELSKIILQNELTSSKEFYDLVFFVSSWEKAEKREITLDILSSYFPLSKSNFFDLAHLFSKRDFSLFFQKLISSRYDFSSYRQFSQFMQGHLYKILGIHLIKNKKKLNRYDRDLIHFTSKFWNTTQKDELVQNWLRMFSRWELLAKKRDSLLHLEIASFAGKFFKKKGS